jgi:hypothetical protein
MTWDHGIAQVAPYVAIFTAIVGTLYVFAGYFH